MPFEVAGLVFKLLKIQQASKALHCARAIAPTFAARKTISHVI
jgi:hypothetical protein